MLIHTGMCITKKYVPYVPYVLYVCIRDVGVYVSTAHQNKVGQNQTNNIFPVPHPSPGYKARGTPCVPGVAFDDNILITY